MTSEWYMDDSDFESARRRDEQIRLIQELVDEQYNQLHGEPDAEGVSENTRRREMKFSSPRLSVSFVDNGFPVGKASWIVGEPTLEIEWDDARPPSEIPIQNLSSKDLQTLFLDTVSNHVIGECGAPVEGYDNLDSELVASLLRGVAGDSPIVTEPDAEFELLLSSEHDELKSVIAHHEQVFQSISALCILWQNGVMDANKVLKSIQNIVKGG